MKFLGETGSALYIEYTLYSIRSYYSRRISMYTLYMYNITRFFFWGEGDKSAYKVGLGGRPKCPPLGLPVQTQICKYDKHKRTFYKSFTA